MHSLKGSLRLSRGFHLIGFREMDRSWNGCVWTPRSHCLRPPRTSFLTCFLTFELLIFCDRHKISMTRRYTIDIYHICLVYFQDTRSLSRKHPISLQRQTTPSTNEVILLLRHYFVQYSEEFFVEISLA